MESELSDAQRPLKRRKIEIQKAHNAYPLSDDSYITIARASFHVRSINADIYKSLLKEQASNKVEVIETSTFNDDKFVKLRIPWRKEVTTIAVDDNTNATFDILNDGAKLPSTATTSRVLTATSPLCCCDTLLYLQEDRAMLDVGLLWHNTAKAEDRVDPTLLEMLWRYHPSGTQSPSNQAEVWDVAEFYDNVHVPTLGRTNDLKVDLMQCQLYPFQSRATNWLLSRELVEIQASGRIVPAHSATEDTLPLDFHELNDTENTTQYASHALGVVCSSREQVQKTYGQFSGGILSEAMGLGKTVEMIALMCLHSRSRTPLQYHQPDGIRPTGATLIITPPTILDQWKQEIREHAPSLKVFHYEGMTSIAKRKQLSLDVLTEHDVVLTTYNVIAKEVHYVKEKPDRQLRARPRTEPPKSPLTQIQWWRCLLDEAQMIESGVSNAATVARLIPRIHAWAVTGTPLKQSHRDLYGLLLFLGHSPWSSSPRMWDYLVFYHRPLLRKLIGQIALRHSKELVRDELRLPPQTRQIITMPFTAIEESHYAQMRHDMHHDCGLDRLGAPLEEDWDPEDPRTVEKMRTWLMRLRQTCLHPEVGGRNRRALGRSGGPLRTVAQVLDVMIEQNDSVVHAEQRNVLMSKSRRGQMLEHARQPSQAQEIFKEVYTESSRVVADCRKDLAEQKAKQKLGDRNVREESVESQFTDENEDEVDASQLAARQRLRSALEVQHICIFFLGNTYFQQKEIAEALIVKAEAETHQTNIEQSGSNPSQKQSDMQAETVVHNISDTFVIPEKVREPVTDLEKLETAAYEEAKQIRTELLAEVHRKADKRIATVKTKHNQNDMVQIPKLDYASDDFGGIESRKVFEKLYLFCKAMNTQAEQLEEIRSKMVDMLRQALIDEDEGVDLTGDEYESSTKHQDEMYVVMEILRALFADRNDAISGQENLLLRQETKQFMRDAKEGRGPAPEMMLKLLNEREAKKVRFAEQGSLRGIVTEIRSLSGALEWQEGSSLRARAELVIVNQLLQHAQKLLNNQSKAMSALEQEVNLFLDTMNARLDYYRALQKISDTVAPYGEEDTIGQPIDVIAFEKLKVDEANSTKKLTTAMSKRRYLLHLKSETTGDGSEKICTICQFDFDIGTLTVCGHQFCKDCIKLWWSEHRNCPVCKRRLTLADFYDVTYKPAEVTIQAENGTQNNEGNSTTAPDECLRNSIYADVKVSTLNEIKNIEIQGASFGSKVDTICRHLHWLRQHDPGSKTIIFSQYRDFLDVLSRALRQNGILHSKFDDKDGIIDFKTNSANECFLLHAKAHSAGLNLVVASHVILCEPLINTALELQAIARVHRIGQQRTTTVWMYLIKDTVEESIYDISVKRRLAHMDRKDRFQSESSRNASAVVSRAQSPGIRGGLRENEIDAANSKELEAADLSKMLESGRSGGEKVDKSDLWQCLFGTIKEIGPEGQLADQMPANGEVGRFLRAEAAEYRM